MLHWSENCVKQQICTLHCQDLSYITDGRVGCPMVWEGYNLQHGHIQRNKQNHGCVTLWPCHLHFKKYLKAKEELWKLKYFTMQWYNLQLKKNPLKRTKILQDIIITLQQLISSFNTSQNTIFQKSSYKNRPIIIT